jgi:hypothetical protein
MSFSVKRSIEFYRNFIFQFYVLNHLVEDPSKQIEINIEGNTPIRFHPGMVRVHSISVSFGNGNGSGFSLENLKNLNIFLC